MVTTVQLTIRKGSTFLWTLLPETATQKYIPITAITMTPTGVRLTAASHGLVEGWCFLISRCKGLTRLNMADEGSPRASDYFQANVIDADTVEINTSNTTGDKSYTGGGVLQYGIPMDLIGCVVRAKIIPTEGAKTVTLDISQYVTISIAACRIDIAVPGTETSLLPGNNLVLGIELEDATGHVFSLPVITLVLHEELVK